MVPVKINFILFIQLVVELKQHRTQTVVSMSENQVIPMLKKKERKTQADCYQSALKDEEPSLIHLKS